MNDDIICDRRHYNGSSPNRPIESVGEFVVKCLCFFTEMFKESQMKNK